MSASSLRRWRWFAAGLAILAMATLDLSPRTKATTLPSATDMAGAIAVLRRIRDSSGSLEPIEVALTRSELEQTLPLAGRAAGFPHTQAELERNAIQMRTSLDLPLGLWLNLSAQVASSRTGFPRITGKIGRLPVPAFVMSGAIEGYRFLLRQKGADIPELDTLVQSLAIERDGISARLQLPPESTFLNLANQRQAQPVEQALVVAHYCRLARLQRDRPAADLAALLRQSFAVAAPDATVTADNRARLVAVAMITGARDAGGLAGVSEAALARCHAPANPIMLLGRVDLARHVALSAAIAVTVNRDFSRRMGVWKEIADSNPNGSGFSFVDLSADRAGLALAQSLSNPETSRATAKHLQTITDEELLPIAALAFAEGMSEQDFRARYVSTQSKDYAEMVARIDAVLSKAY